MAQRRLVAGQLKAQGRQVTGRMADQQIAQGRLVAGQLRPQGRQVTGRMADQQMAQGRLVAGMMKMHLPNQSDHPQIAFSQ